MAVRAPPAAPRPARDATRSATSRGLESASPATGSGLVFEAEQADLLVQGVRVTKRRQLVVVDGSNLATEGRATPSLRQLDEAVRAFLDEHADTEVVVVVDATFEHRIAAAERAQFKQAELAGEVVTPPAGVVGRGDAFILKIAKRCGRDRPVERLVPGVPRRAPVAVRGGPPHRGQARPPRRLDLHAPQPGPGAQVEGRHDQGGARREGGPDERIADAVAAASPTTPPDERAGRRRRRLEPAGPRSRRRHPPSAPQRRRRRRRPPRRRRRRSARRRGVLRPRRAPAKEATKTAGTRARSAKAAPAKASAAPKARPEPVNTSRSFLRLVADHPLGGTVEGEVVQFTSHGAMVSVPRRSDDARRLLRAARGTRHTDADAGARRAEEGRGVPVQDRLLRHHETSRRARTHPLSRPRPWRRRHPDATATEVQRRPSEADASLVDPASALRAGSREPECSSRMRLAASLEEAQLGPPTDLRPIPGIGEFSRIAPDGAPRGQ